MTRISIVAPSSVVPQAELTLGVASLRDAGFEVQVDAQCRKKELFFAGTHEQRARALVDHAYSDDSDMIWCARGGYGSNHLLKYLDAATRHRGKPRRKKLLAGSSDSTSLLEFARARWGFSVLHSPMPGLRNFLLLSAEERASVLGWVKGEPPARPWGKVRRLKWIGKAPARAIVGEVVGGNLTVWNTMLGTAFQPRLAAASMQRRPVQGKILFLEDVTETLPRLDRSVRHLVDAGGLDGVQAIVLGNFLSCDDAVPQVIGKVPAHWTVEELRKPPLHWMMPLRRKFSSMDGIRRIFAAISEETGVPVAFGLPVGHGPEHFSLPLGAQARLARDGSFQIQEWGWLDIAASLR